MASRSQMLRANSEGKVEAGVGGAWASMLEVAVTKRPIVSNARNRVPRLFSYASSSDHLMMTARHSVW